MRIVWLSANKFGYELLKEALKCKLPDSGIEAVITLAEGSDTIMYDGVPENEWRSLGLPVRAVRNINEDVAIMNELRPDVVVMCGWRQIIGPDVLSAPKASFVGFHPTLLPKGRGPAPIINTILNGETRSGVTMFYVDGSLDGGDVIGQEGFDISADDYASDVYGKVVEAGMALVRKYLPMVTAGNAPRVKQDESEATYLEKRSLKDNEIDLSKDSPETIRRKIRAFSNPYRGAFIKVGGKKLVIWKADLAD